MKHFTFLIVTVFTFFNCSKESVQTTDEPVIEIPTEIYFPEINSDTWETETITDLNWNENQLAPLLTFLEENNTKSFMILHKGKIVVEEYLNDHTSSTPWYWASAGKTLSSTITGIAQDQGYIDLDAKVSKYLGTGWTSASTEKEDLITCKNLLTMTSGLDESLGDNTSSDNLVYTSDAGNRWAYHNVYVKIQDVISEATNNTWEGYFNSELKNKIGMSGSWTESNDLSIYWSNTRSMARFGLLMSADGKWDDTQIAPSNFITEATTVSQDINLSYGYLWWLNGKESYHLPNSQVEFSGSLIPNAPNDMIAALGLNDQKIYIVPSENLVIIRMGQAADEENFALSSFDDELWEMINNLID